MKVVEDNDRKTIKFNKQLNVHIAHRKKLTKSNNISTEQVFCAI